MKLSEFKKHLEQVNVLTFIQPNGVFVPRHFHITEIGLVTKNFIDCGGTIHNEQTASMQIWVAEDFDHRLKPSGLIKIIDLSKQLISNQEVELVVEYQTETIGTYGLQFDGENFVLTAKQTDCLAKEKCGIPELKPQLATTEAGAGCCTPGGGCC